MKKIYLILACLLVCNLFVYADEATMTDALKTCSPYTESGSLRTEGMNVNSTKHIMGWQGDKCVYQEVISFSGINAVTSCKLTQSQLNEIVSVTNAFSLVNGYTGESIDTSSLDNVKDNPVVKVWSKYLQDPSACNVEIK